MSSLYVLYDNPELNLRVRPQLPEFTALKNALNSASLWLNNVAAKHDLAQTPAYILKDAGLETLTEGLFVRSFR